MIYRDFVKIYIDKIFAFVLLILLSPVFIVIGLMMFLNRETPILFVQTRTGKGLKRFNLYKFRTLRPTDSNDLSMEKRRFTAYGKSLRRTGLDELPQLINILKGDMSFVGPRPLPAAYDVKYSQAQLRRFDTLPGITGRAQIRGRNDTSWELRFENDLWYTDHISFVSDLKIIMLTVFQIFRSVFYHNEKHIEMPVFEGSNLN